MEGCQRYDGNRMDLRWGRCSGEGVGWDRLCWRSIGDLVSNNCQAIAVACSLIQRMMVTSCVVCTMWCAPSVLSIIAGLKSTILDIIPKE